MLSTWGANETAHSTAQAGGNDVRMQFSSLDDLHGLIRHARTSAGWEGVQLSRDPIRGSVVSRSGRKSRQTSTMVSGSFALEGPISGANPVIVVAVDFAQSGLFWRSETGTGSIAMIQPGEEIQSLCRSQSSYLTVDIDRQALEEEMLRNDITPRAGLLDATGVLAGGVPPACLAGIQHGVAALHRGAEPDLPPGYDVEQIVLSSIVGLFSRQCGISRDPKTCSYARTVARAREHIEANIERPISIDELCNAACASKRTLHRAFMEVTSDTPQQYILKLRLNRIRRDLANAEEAQRTVTVVSMRWGITELGRLAARYREQFGELPSDTLHRRRGFAPAASSVCAPPARLARPAEPQLRHNLHCDPA